MCRIKNYHYEVCSHCDTEIRAKNEGVTICPNCGNDVLPCLMCDMNTVNCRNCPYTNKKLFCIIGRTASGKDTIAKYLNKTYGLTSVKSYTTRPRREKEEDTHIFISSKEAEEIMAKSKVVAYTKIGDYEYFATEEQLKENDIYIIDYLGLQELKEKIADSKIDIISIYLKCSLPTIIERATKLRKDDKDVFEKRMAAEAEQFDMAENNLDTFSYVVDTERPCESVLSKIVYENL